MPFIGDPWEEHEFEDMPQTGLHAETGLGNSNQTASLTLEHLWSVMKPVYLKRLGRERQHGLIKVYFFMAFVYMKLYNTTAAWNKWFTWGPQYNVVCYKTFLTVTRPMIYMMAVHLDEIRWDDRLAYENHHSFFPTGVSFIVDTFPIIVYSPTDPLARAMLYVPDKYAAVVFKGEIVTDLLGRVISFTALHLGVMHDATIWSLGKHLRPTLVGEYGLGDRIYSPCPDLITDFLPIANQGPGVPPPPLTAAESDWNSKKNGVRSRVEHSVAEQQRPFGIYQTKFRGDPAVLEACQVVTAQANRAARRIIGPKYSGFGWQPHV